MVGLGSMLLVAGALLAWGARLERVGVGAALALGAWLVLVLAVAMPFGWAAWQGTAALAVVLLVAGGLAARRWRTGERPARPSGLSVALLAVFALGVAVPAAVLPVPLDTDAQGFGYLALTAKLAGDLTTLAPLNPIIDYLYAPGFTVLAAYLSETLGTPLHSTQFAAGAVLAMLVMAVLLDVGYWLGGAARGRAQVIAAVIGTGLLTAYMDSHYTSLLGLALGGAFLALVYRLATHETAHPWRDGAAGAVCLAALALSHPDTTIIIGLGFGPWLLLMPLGRPRPSWRRWLAAAAGVPLAALAMVLPWLLSVRHLLGSEIESPFARQPEYWRIVLGVPPEILYHGVLIGWWRPSGW